MHTASDLRLVLSTPLGNDFHLSWYRSLHISHMFCTCFVRCFACLAPFRLIFSRIGWTSTWCCDGRLAKPAQCGAAPLVCCSAVTRQEYQTSESNSGIFRSPPPCWTTPPTPADPTRSKSLQLPPPRTHLGRLYLAILAPRCPSRRQVGPQI